MPITTSLTCFASQVPYFKCPIVTAGNNSGRLSQELSCHNLSGVASEGVLHKQKDITYVNWTGFQWAVLSDTIHKQYNELQSEVSNKQTSETLRQKLRIRINVGTWNKRLLRQISFPSFYQQNKNQPACEQATMNHQSLRHHRLCSTVMCMLNSKQN
jgi:hypothetical protein